LVLALRGLGLFCEKSPLCRAPSTIVERRQAGQDGRMGQKAEDRRQKTGDRRQKTEDRRQETGDRRQETEDRRQETEDRRQETEGRRGNPDLVGMGVLAVASFSISRILYLLDVYYISKTVGCQVNSSLTADYADCADWDRFKPRRRQGTRDER